MKFDNIYESSTSFRVLEYGIENDGKHNVTSQQRNNNVYMGLGSSFNTTPKWFGKINGVQYTNDTSDFTVQGIDFFNHIDTSMDPFSGGNNT